MAVRESGGPASQRVTLSGLRVVDVGPPPAFGGDGKELLDRLTENSRYFRAGMEAAGFALIPGHHPIIPVMLGDAILAQQMAGRMLEKGIYVVGFSFPVVPKGQARIRTQMSAAHTKDHLDRAIEAFIDTGRELDIID